MTTQEMSPQLFVLLSGLVADRAGLHYGPKDQEVFATKVWASADDDGFTSLMDYYYYLRYDDTSGEALARLVEALVVPETYLFRDPEALRVVADELTDRARRTGGASAWSAACSTGEEPLTLAILLAERGVLDRVRVVASDVSARALERARSGRLGRRAVRDQVPPEVLGRWVHPDDAGYHVEPALLGAIRWEQVNLVERDQVRAVADAPFDVVLLRNVLIYFDDATVQRVIAHVREVLRPGGFVVLGASESLVRFGTGLRLEERGGTFVYRDPEEGG